jgi:hypothetical protein
MEVSGLQRLPHDIAFAISRHPKWMAYGQALPISPQLLAGILA